MLKLLLQPMLLNLLKPSLRSLLSGTGGGVVTPANAVTYSDIVLTYGEEIVTYG